MELTLLDLQNFPEPMRYCRQYSEGVAGLARKFSSVLSESPTIYALVPKGTDLSRASELERGGLVTTRASLDWLVSHILSLERKNGSGTFLVQDMWAVDKDTIPHKEVVETGILLHQDESYFWVGKGNFFPKRITEALRLPLSFVVLAAYSRFALNAMDVTKDCIIPERSFEGLLGQITEFYLSAYDQESFLLIAPRNST